MLELEPLALGFQFSKYNATVDSGNDAAVGRGLCPHIDAFVAVDNDSITIIDE